MYFNAEEALSTLAAGWPVDRSLAIVGALELQALAELPGAPVDMRNVHHSLQRVASGGELNLTVDSRRIAQLADVVRAFRGESEALLALSGPAASSNPETAPETGELSRTDEAVAAPV